MNKKAEVGTIGIIFLFLVFLVLWFLWLGSWVGEIGQAAVASQGLTGIEAFFFANLNLVILFGALLGMLGFMYLQQ